MAMGGPGGRERRMLSEINVTPLVDVSLVLLIIFMVTTPMLQRGTDVQLPQAAVADVKEAERLTLTLTREGRVFLNAEEVPRAALAERLRAVGRTLREKVVYFRGDANVPYGAVIEVMDAVKAAGIETIGMITDRPRAK
jgi:biopolymer transport protein TolR